MVDITIPHASEQVEKAIQQAVDFIIDRYDKVIGIIAAGSILRGEGDLNSDVDTFVIIEGDYRQRLHKFFNGVRFELFINAVEFVPLYFEEERRDGGPSTAHMLTTGYVVLNRDSRVDDLIKQAKETLEAGPDYDEQSLTLTRYMLADRLENGFDLRYRDPVMGQVLLDSALPGMLEYHFKKQSQWVPRHKDILAVLRQETPDLAQLVHQYYQATGDKRYTIAGLIADYIIGVRGFFEWEMGKDYLD